MWATTSGEGSYPSGSRLFLLGHTFGTRGGLVMGPVQLAEIGRPGNLQKCEPSAVPFQNREIQLLRETAFSHSRVSTTEKFKKFEEYTTTTATACLLLRIITMENINALCLMSPRLCAPINTNAVPGEELLMARDHFVDASALQTPEGATKIRVGELYYNEISEKEDYIIKRY